MNRRTLVLSAAAMLATVSKPANAQSQGIKIRFVITRLTTRSDGAVEKATYENALLLAPSERFETNLEGYRIGLRAVPVSDGVKVEVALRDLGRSMAQSITGEATVKMGQGGGIDFPAQETGLYAVGLLVTQQALPSKGAA
ncbi:hypothetical protein [Paucibacter sp. Y2R2-4]|uniref:hypothetical protein n=1 Tax=Paucibacter sp. Y2R2-4 TaxID=2893553 RepID=UPI0021E419F9|nr:hypothetical protein [Paucibacter sp. Y2R2-4]MCV2351111.1 hypothetical protein [Paucibacter sp. Y2R2-4]